MIRPIVLAPLTALAACAGSAPRAPDTDAATALTATRPTATPVGKPENCVPIRSIRNTVVRSDRVIDFQMLGGRTYRNVLPASCPSLGFEQRFGYATSISQLCSVDIITVLYQTPVARGASCGLGQFQPVTLAPK